MSENRLTPAEIEALLGQFADNAGVVSTPSDVQKSPAERGGNHRETLDESRRESQTPPSHAERKRRNRLWAIHEQAARDAGIALSAMLRAPVDVRLLGVESIPCRSVVMAMEANALVCLLRSEAISSQLILEMPTAILLPMLDRMLGGSVDGIFPSANRPLSEIEQRLALRLVSCIAHELNRAWEGAYSLALAVDRIEADPGRLSIGPPDGEAITVSFDIRLGKARAALHFAIPPQAMDVLDPHLATEQNPAVAGHYRSIPAYFDSPADQAELTVELNPSSISAEDVANLSVGDVITTEHRVDAPVIVHIDGQPKFLGRIGATAGRKAVRIEKLADEAEPSQ